MMFSQDLDLKLTSLTIDDCAAHCADELGFECQSFEFCYLNGDCRLSKNLVPSDTKNTTVFAPNYYCDIYESKNI